MSNHAAPMSDGAETSTLKATLQWFVVAFLIYLLITAVGMIGGGFKGATRGDAAQLFEFATNPFMGLVVGILATSLIQSSSTVTSIIVGLVAGGLPVEMAIPMVMGGKYRHHHYKHYRGAGSY